jgi:hypothetical protein
MKVIVNSDIIYHSQLVTENMSERLQALFQACSDRGHTIIIPLTTLYEFDRQQLELVQKEISQLESAYKLLDKFKIRYSKIEPSKVVKKPELTGLIKQYAMNVIVEEPTFEDLKEAHKRACLHQSPHPPNIKSDEMRDLVIWFIALRLASRDGGALLISCDELHTNERGDSEANRVSLFRVRSIEEALEFLDVETPAGRIIKELLETVWVDLLDAGLPLTPAFSLIGVSGTRFIQGVHGIALASFTFKAKTPDLRIIQAITRIDTVDGIITKVTLSDITLEGETWQEKPLPLVIYTNKAFSLEPDDFQERIDALKLLLEEQS